MQRPWIRSPAEPCSSADFELTLALAAADRRMIHRACPYPPDEKRIFHGNRIGGDESEAALNTDDALPGFEQLQHELERVAANPELQERELRLRAHFDEAMPPAAPRRFRQEQEQASKL